MWGCEVQGSAPVVLPLVVCESLFHIIPFNAINSAYSIAPLKVMQGRANRFVSSTAHDPNVSVCTGNVKCIHKDCAFVPGTSSKLDKLIWF